MSASSSSAFFDFCLGFAAPLEKFDGDLDASPLLASFGRLGTSSASISSADWEAPGTTRFFDDKAAAGACGGAPL